MSIPLIGNWDEGYALDLHTSSSTPIYDENGELARFENVYTTIGELVNKLKYRGERNAAAMIAKESVDRMKSNLVKWQIDVVVTIPPSNQERVYQPVIEIARSFTNITKLPLDINALIKIRATPQMITINDPEERRRLLNGVFDVVQNSFVGKNVMVIDDLYRSGETLNAATNVLRTKGGAKSIYVLTMTKTRIHR